MNFTGGKKNSEQKYENYSSYVLFSKRILTYKLGLLLWVQNTWTLIYNMECIGLAL
jgi:hypothetical protein